MYLEFGAQHAVCFRIARSLERSGLVLLAHIRAHAFDDLLDDRILVRQREFLRQREIVVGSLRIDCSLNQAGNGLLGQCVEKGPKKRIESSLDVE
ncbi:hypothetical protein [Paraburkholderia sacchari]|uniref:hypothetical protein n=1 Tax=Paraburkholderia sacchari TaxID=159450 RepID=UPI001BCF8A4A|nr:hypothetical protein [Paraburkholderia sacchari]